jgi:Tol biopolymer transport system component
MNPDGSDPQRLTESSGEDSWPVWSADGTKMAFASHRDGHAEIYVMDADGSNQGRVTNTPQPGESWMPSWSPDGKYIAFSTSDYRAADIYKVKPDGTGLTNLTNLPAGHDASYPSWSPDGSRIIYQKRNPIDSANTISAR